MTDSLKGIFHYISFSHWKYVIYQNQVKTVGDSVTL